MQDGHGGGFARAAVAALSRASAATTCGTVLAELVQRGPSVPLISRLHAAIVGGQLCK